MRLYCTIKGGSRRAEKSRKVLMMMMKAAKLGWAGPGAGQGRGKSKARAGQRREQGRSRAGAGQEQGRKYKRTFDTAIWQKKGNAVCICNWLH